MTLEQELRRIVERAGRACWKRDWLVARSDEVVQEVVRREGGVSQALARVQGTPEGRQVAQGWSVPPAAPGTPARVAPWVDTVAFASLEGLGGDGNGEGIEGLCGDRDG